MCAGLPGSIRWQIRLLRIEEDWFGPFTFDNNKSKEVMWSVQSQYAKGTLFQWQFERYNHYNAKNYFDLSGYSSTNGMHLQPSLKPNGDPYTDKLGRPLPNSTIKIFVKIVLV